MSKKVIAVDIGASSGKMAFGEFDGSQLLIREYRDFVNRPVEIGTALYWDVFSLHNAIIDGMAYFKEKYGEADTVAIDTWGASYGLLDKKGRLMEPVYHYRDERTRTTIQDMNDVMDTYELFQLTGCQCNRTYTLPQLYSYRTEGSAVLDNADSMLLLPDLLGYFLTGEKKSEYTEVTTTMLYNPTTKDWDWETIRELGLPEHIFTEIDRAGTLRGHLRPELAKELGLNEASFAAVGTHDTASAVAAIPGTGSFAFCSSGTWSLFGVETDEPILRDDVRSANFSNEGTIQGGFRPLRNIMGLWLIQECRRDWIKAGHTYSWNEIVVEAEKAEPFRSIIDPDFGEFFAGGQMIEKIQSYCRNTDQPVPETVGQIARCIYESLALKYRWALERLEEIKGQRIDQLNIVGGGCQNKLLNQFVADSLDRPVVTGPVEGAAIGNLLAQAMALGEIKDIAELREVVRRSEAVAEFQPHHTHAWEAAYQKLLALAK